MNSRLVICLLLSALAGVTAGGGAVVAGLGPIAGVFVWSLSGSLSLVAATTIAQPGLPRHSVPHAAAEATAA